jgi:hypothetical protein
MLNYIIEKQQPLLIIQVEIVYFSIRGYLDFYKREPRIKKFADGPEFNRVFLYPR